MHSEFQKSLGYRKRHLLKGGGGGHEGHDKMAQQFKEKPRDLSSIPGTCIKLEGENQFYDAA